MERENSTDLNGSEILKAEIDPGSQLPRKPTERSQVARPSADRYEQTMERMRLEDSLADSAECSLLARIGRSEAQRIVRCEIATMREALLKEGDSALEVLLVRQVCLCYLTVQAFQAQYVDDQENRLGLKAHALMLKRLDQANWRYMQAMKTLAQVRRLRKLTVQVNIGEKQVNIANVEGLPSL